MKNPTVMEVRYAAGSCASPPEKSAGAADASSATARDTAAVNASSGPSPPAKYPKTR